MNRRCQEDVWARAFGKEKLNINPEERSLLVTEPLLAPRSVQEEHDELVFETFGFRAHYRCCAPLLAALNFKNDFPTSQFANSPAHLVVDAGYSFTHAVPCFDFHALNYAVKRVNVGGKLLTNFLKESVSYQHIDVHEETWLMNQAKEDCCFVSLKFMDDLRNAECGFTRPALGNNNIMCEYSLPGRHPERGGLVVNDRRRNSKNTTRKSHAAQRRNNQLLRAVTERDSGSRPRGGDAGTANEGDLLRGMVNWHDADLTCGDGDASGPVSRKSLLSRTGVDPPIVAQRGAMSKPHQVDADSKLHGQKQIESVTESSVGRQTLPLNHERIRVPELLFRHA